MRLRTLMLASLLIAIIVIFLFVEIELKNAAQQPSSKFYVGVEFAYSNGSDNRSLVDKVKGYTNLLVLGLPETSLNETLLNETCNYVSGAGLSFIVLFSNLTAYDYNYTSWIQNAKLKYGDKFVGVYRIDEPAGKQLDGVDMWIPSAQNYSEAAQEFEGYVGEHIDYFPDAITRTFTSDYGLYWFDYKAGYSTVFAEFGFNNSRQLNIALCRSAAQIQSRDWGTIITWKFDAAPYVESPGELYDDMVLSYDAGAKYVVVFDYPLITEYGALTEQHFEAMRNFWNYVQTHPRSSEGQEQVAYILPSDYGFGLRNPNDTIWGLWPADQFSGKIWSDINNLVSEYGYNFGIAYDDLALNNATSRYYKTLIFWNGTTT